MSQLSHGKEILRQLSQFTESLLSMVEELSIGQRLKIFCNAAYDGNVVRMAESMNPPRSHATIYPYLNDMRAPGTPFLLAFIEMGLNAQWLLTGSGPATAPNLQGEKIASNLNRAIKEYLSSLEA